jgi:hypothetical protein
VKGSDQPLTAPGPSSAWRERCLAALLATLPLSLFGELLLRRTHHRPLGAATFASAAVLLFALTCWSTSRLSGFTRSVPSHSVPSHSVPSHSVPNHSARRTGVVWALAAVGLVVVIGRLLG